MKLSGKPENICYFTENPESQNIEMCVGMGETLASASQPGGLMYPVKVFPFNIVVHFYDLRVHRSTF